MFSWEVVEKCFFEIYQQVLSNDCILNTLKAVEYFTSNANKQAS